MILPERVLGSAGANWIFSGAAMPPMSLRTSAFSSLRKRVVAFLAGVQGDEGVDRLALDVVGDADDRGLGDHGVRRPASFRPRRVPMRWPETLMTSSTRPVIQ